MYIYSLCLFLLFSPNFKHWLNLTLPDAKLCCQVIYSPSFFLIAVFSNEGRSFQVKLGLCVYRSAVYHGNTKFASFFKVNVERRSYEVASRCELMGPHSGPLRGSESIPKCLTVSVSILVTLLYAIISLFFQDKRLCPSLNEHNN